jgi:hypothetical protein
VLPSVFCVGGVQASEAEPVAGGLVTVVGGGVVGTGDGAGAGVTGSATVGAGAVTGATTVGAGVCAAVFVGALASGAAGAPVCVESVALTTGAPLLQAVIATQARVISSKGQFLFMKALHYAPTPGGNMSSVPDNK